MDRLPPQSEPEGLAQPGERWRAGEHIVTSFRWESGHGDAEVPEFPSLHRKPLSRRIFLPRRLEAAARPLADTASPCPRASRSRVGRPQWIAA